jgi:hypothetical protein
MEQMRWLGPVLCEREGVEAVPAVKEADTIVRLERESWAFGSAWQSEWMRWMAGGS